MTYDANSTSLIDTFYNRKINYGRKKIILDYDEVYYYDGKFYGTYLENTDSDIIYKKTEKIIKEQCFGTKPHQFSKATTQASPHKKCESH